MTSGGVTTSTVYVSNLEEVSTTGSTTTTTTYYYAAGKRIALAVNGVFSYPGTDGLGSPDVALDANGNVQASTLYGPYGAVRYSSGSMPGSYAFTGQRADATTGLDYYNARYYDPVAQQFASADTLADGLNRYGYVGGNPETNTDPSGHVMVCGMDCLANGPLPPAPTPTPPCSSCTNPPPGGGTGPSSGPGNPGTPGQTKRSANTSGTISGLTSTNSGDIAGDVGTIVAGIAMMAGAVYLIYQSWPVIQGDIAATGPVITTVFNVFGFAVRNPLLLPLAAFDGLLIVFLTGLSLAAHALDDILVRTGNGNSEFRAIVLDVATGADAALAVAVGVEALLVGDTAFSIGGLVGAVATGLTALVAWSGLKGLWQNVVNDFQEMQNVVP